MDKEKRLEEIKKKIGDVPKTIPATELNDLIHKAGEEIDKQEVIDVLTKINEDRKTAHRAYTREEKDIVDGFEAKYGERELNRIIRGLNPGS